MGDDDEACSAGSDAFTLVSAALLVKSHFFMSSTNLLGWHMWFALLRGDMISEQVREAGSAPHVRMHCWSSETFEAMPLVTA